MKFAEHNQESKKRGIGGSGIFALQDGENKIRVLSEPEGFSQHFLGAGIKPPTCIGEECEYCEAGNKKSNKIALYVVDRADEKVKLAIMPWSIYVHLGTLAESSEWGFKDLPPYDLIIKKTGKGLETEYTVAPSRNEAPINPDQLEQFMAKKPILEVIQNMMKAQITEDAPAHDPSQYPEA